MSQLGRISGPLLKDNLIRDGVDLAFDTDLLYLDVNNRRIGNNTDAPVRDLNVIGKTYINGDLIATGTTAKLGNLIINSSNNVNSTTGPIIIQPTGPDAYIQYGDTTNANIRIKDNFLRVTNTNGNIDFDPAGAGKVLINSSSTVDGNVVVGGSIRSNQNVTLGGVLTVGNNQIDTLTVNTDFTQTIVPGDDNTYDLGTPVKRWRNFRLNENFNTSSATITTLFISDQTRFVGNSIDSIQSNDDLVFSANTKKINLESLQFGDTFTIIPTGVGIITQTRAFIDCQIPFSESSKYPFLVGSTFNQGMTIYTINNISAGYLVEYPISSGNFFVSTRLELTNGIGGPPINVTYDMYSTFDIVDPGIIKNLLNSRFEFISLGTGYLKVDDTNAMRVPVGTTAERVGAEQGETRWNTDLDYLECFDGTVWQVATGGGVVVTAPIMEEFADVYTLIFG